MSVNRVKISSVVDNQLPEFVRSEFPLFKQFLRQYYLSVDSTSLSFDIIQNIDEYIKLDKILLHADKTTLTETITPFSKTIKVSSTNGFPDTYGLLYIDDEIITYKSKSSTEFYDCVRGFSGVTSYENNTKPDSLVFKDTTSKTHTVESIVQNLSILFLGEFLKKIKKQIVPGFENKELFENLDQRLFLKQSRDFYLSKGTTKSFDILFGALYGKSTQVIFPRDNIIEASSAIYRIVNDLVVESIDGDPLDLVNNTLYQDKDDIIPNSARGTITNVEKITKNNRDFYVISLDYDYNKDIGVRGSLLGEFKIHPKTLTTSGISQGGNYIDVDSTFGFLTSGVVKFMKNGIEYAVNYQSKTETQFLDCDELVVDLASQTEIYTNTFAYSYNSKNELIKLRLTGVLSDLNITDSSLYLPEDKINVLSLGKGLTEENTKHWFYNIATWYNIESLELLDESDFTYNIKTYDQNTLNVGNEFIIVSNNGIFSNGIIVNKTNNFNVTIKGQGELQNDVKYRIEKKITKFRSSNYQNLNIYSSNVSNVYSDDDDSIYVNSSSLPTYIDKKTFINDRKIDFYGVFNSTVIEFKNQNNIPINHGLYTGEKIYYSSNEQIPILPEGVYFVYVINNTTIKFSKSKENLSNQIFVEANGTATGHSCYYYNFVSDNNDPKELRPQNIIKKLTTPTFDNNRYETVPGGIGIFNNGVELYNYKSNDILYHGPINKIVSISSGENYDVINPPSLIVSDENGSGVSGFLSVEGSLKRIDIIDPGFNFIETPVVEIKGGSGVNAKADCNLISYDYFVTFIPKETNNINLTNNTIIFTNDHKFGDDEEIIYNNNGNPNVGGLINDSNYFVKVIDSKTIKLFSSKENSLIGNTPINLSSASTGIHKLTTVKKKRKIGSITVSNGGYGYKNNKTFVTGISTFSDQLNIIDHNYESGEIVAYLPDSTPIVGLTSSTEYYVTKIDNDNIKLSEIGVGLTVNNYYYKTRQFVDIISSGSGNHYFNYTPIEVNIIGQTGVSTFSGNNYTAVVQPIFHGSITSYNMENNGENYGDVNIINYNKQPVFNIVNGSGAQLLPIINNGKFENVIVQSSGDGYNSPPDIIVRGVGTGVVLTPVIVDGKISRVVINSPGIGYFEKSTTIEIVPRGQNAKFEALIKTWRINDVERAINKNLITEDDGFLQDGINIGLEYSHIYCPRLLRESLLTKKFINGTTVLEKDLLKFNGVEILSSNHSPIIGWAYDGNPIYGPYGYSTVEGGVARLMKSGYTLKTINELTSQNRPPISLYPVGTFIEDYIFTGDGDLDESNGRYAKTPEYPNGVYAYYSTFDEITASNGPFQNYRKPKFPYVIGKSYNSLPIAYNFERNNKSIDSSWIKNTSPYKFLNNNSGYLFLYEPYKRKDQINEIVSTSSGNITSIDVLKSGENYKVNDQILLDENSATVSEILGVGVSSIATNEIYLPEVTIVKSTLSSQYIGITSLPHGLKNNDNIVFNSNEIPEFISNININVNQLTLTSNVEPTTVTGIVTYFSVVGDLNFPRMIIDDIYSINNEEIKVLDIDKTSSRLRVRRNYNDTIGLTTHYSGARVVEIPKKIYFNTFNGISNAKNYELNIEHYINPSESIGLGTTSGPGISSTLYITNPGAGSTLRVIPTRSVYIDSHQLNTNDIVKYENEDNNPIEVSNDGIASYGLSTSTQYYVTKIDNNLIGLSTSLDNDNLFFTGIGTGIYHKFIKESTNTVVGELFKNEITVNTTSNHQLDVLDKINLRVNSGISTTIVVKYDEHNRRLLINPLTITSVILDDNIVIIDNHKLKTGEKLIYTSTSPIGGLESNLIYYVVRINRNKIKLASSKVDSLRNNVIELTSTGDGILSLINPSLNAYKNNNLIFDLSDSSLSYVKNSVTLPAFDFNIYYNSSFSEIFLSSGKSSNFEVQKNGSIGVTSTANLILTVNDNIPKILYYSLTPVNDTFDINKEYFVDTEQNGNNKIQILNSNYNGEYEIKIIDSSLFKVNGVNELERDRYNDNILYTTTSTQASGGIFKVNEVNTRINYNKLPQINNIISENGKDAYLKINHSGIGSITSVNIKDIGFNYSNDPTLRPEAKSPEILRISPLSKINTINVTYSGFNYNISPELVVIDNFSNKIIDDIILDFNSELSKIDIIKNTKSINNIIPKIIPVNNSNGVGISSIFYNEDNERVTLTLTSQYSDIEDFPFTIGSKILIENTVITNSGKSYNTEDYDYELFTIESFDANIGGIGATITYNMAPFLLSGESPGTFDSTVLSGQVVPESYFPLFDITLSFNEFALNEKIISENKIGNVARWDKGNSLLFVDTTDKFDVGNSLTGQTTGTKAIILETITKRAFFDINASSVIRKNWLNNKGFLNNDDQRIHDSDYYQYFSYAVESDVSINEWSSSVETLNHTAGFKKFGNLNIYSTNESNFITTSQENSSFESEVDYHEVTNIGCRYDYDSVTENALYIGNKLRSNELYLNNSIVQDYFESIGNRVLTIDNISDQFSSSTDLLSFVDIDTRNSVNTLYQKNLINIQDSEFIDDSQFIIISNLNNSNINPYSLIYNSYDIANFETVTIGDSYFTKILPVKSTVNNYDINILSFNINTNIIGISTIDFGNISKLQTEKITVGLGTTTTNVVGISSFYRAGKIEICYYTTNIPNEYYEIDELTFIHNDQEVFLGNYGQITNSETSSVVTGLGTYVAYLSGSNINIDLVPNAGFAATTQAISLQYLLSNDVNTGIGTIQIGDNIIDSTYVNISPSGSPTENIIATFTNQYLSGHYIVSIEDKTNNEYQLSEISMMYNSSLNETYLTVYGNIYSNDSLGEFSGGVTGSSVELYFTPEPNINCQIRLLSIKSALNNTINSYMIDYLNISNSSGTYMGSLRNLNKQFELFSNNLEIFERQFDATNTNIVDLTENTISIPNHYFTTGEELIYSISSSISDFSIGIGTTTLPTTVYAVKVNDSKIQLATSAENALKSIPEVIDLQTLGGSQQHCIKAVNQVNKTLISIDNIIQQPIVSVGTTYLLAGDATTFTNIFYVNDTTSIFANDILKIDNEYINVDAVGVASTNSINVTRGVLNSEKNSHQQGAVITKYYGDYTISDNTINFVSAPYGNVPVIENNPDSDEIDYSGITTSSTFSGRVFMRNAQEETTIDPYQQNYLFDSISDQFTAYENEFTLTQNGQNITGISTGNAILLIRNIFQQPQRLGGQEILGNYTITENAGISSIVFTGTASSTLYDINSSTLPRGGIIEQVGSYSGFGYQPTVSAGGTAIVSAGGTISSISIGNSGGGYRTGIQTYVSVGVQTTDVIDTNIEYIGFANIVDGFVDSVSITNPGSGYTNTNPPKVVFDNPIGYSNIPLIYANGSGQGNGATVDIIVSSGSSIATFEMRNFGYGYSSGDVLTVGVGGTVGVQTTTVPNFEEFLITVDSIYNDEFSGMTIGDLEVLDPIDDLFDGNRTVFQLKLRGNPISIRSKPGSNIDITSTLLVFINDIIQVPYESYEFIGGSLIKFNEPILGPQPNNQNSGNTSKILFYKGSGDIDVQFTDLLETLKVGDEIFLHDDNKNFKQDKRIIRQIQSSDIIKTNNYAGVGINSDRTYNRTLTWCPQNVDKVINGSFVTKDRVIYESNINPFAYLIKNIDENSDEIFVDNLKTFFDNENESTSLTSPFRTIQIISQAEYVSATATAIVSSSGTVSQIDITNSGFGYYNVPEITIDSVGIGTTAQAIAILSDSTVGIVSIISGGNGYDINNPPKVLISPPTFINEIIENVQYSGDFGIIVGYSTIQVGVGSTGLQLDLYVPPNSYLRNDVINTTGLSTTGVSGIQTNFYFTVKNSNIGNTFTSLNKDGDVIGVGNTFIDNIYQAISVSTAQTSVTGIGITDVARVVVYVDDYNGLTGIGFSDYYGDYSWGRISGLTRRLPKSHDSYVTDISGINTSSVVIRYKPLNYENYVV